MDIKELEYFITIADIGNLTNASKKLYISQPALSKYIQKIENEHESIFFERIEKTYRLTEAGKKYYAYAKSVLALSNTIDNELKGLRNYDNGTLKVGIPSLRANACLDYVLKNFRVKYPNVNVEVIVKESKVLQEMLESGNIDLLFTLQNKKSKNLQYENIAKEHVHVIVGEDSLLNEIAKKNNGLYIKDLKDENLLLQSKNQRTTERIVSLFNKLGIVPKISEATNLIVAATLAANGYGVSFLSDNLIKHYNINKNHYPLLDDEDLYFSVAYRASYLLNDYAKEFIRIMKEIYSI